MPCVGARRLIRGCVGWTDRWPPQDWVHLPAATARPALRAGPSPVAGRRRHASLTRQEGTTARAPFTAGMAQAHQTLATPCACEVLADLRARVASLRNSSRSSSWLLHGTEFSNWAVVEQSALRVRGFLSESLTVRSCRRQSKTMSAKALRGIHPSSPVPGTAHQALQGSHARVQELSWHVYPLRLLQTGVAPSFKPSRMSSAATRASQKWSGQRLG